MSGSQDYPKYHHPPVAEVVMSVQFDPLTALAPVHLGRWWTDERRARYPVMEERPPLEQTREEFAVPNTTGLVFNFKLLGSPPTPAIWFLTRDRTELLQVQRDRFSRNWTRQSSEADYPSYDALWPAFEEEFVAFTEFLAGEGIGEPIVEQCELTYVNPIGPGPEWDRHGQLSKLLVPWSEDQTEPAFLPEPEDVQATIRYRIPGPDGEPAGRLYVTAQPVWSAGPEPRILLTLSARGRPFGPGIEGVQAFLETGHEWIVRGFSALTTTPMQNRWERYQ